MKRMRRGVRNLKEVNAEVRVEVSIVDNLKRKIYKSPRMTVITDELLGETDEFGFPPNILPPYIKG